MERLKWLRKKFIPLLALLLIIAIVVGVFYLYKNYPDKIGELLNANFDQRRKIYKLSEENIRMVETARSIGASAKFTGSGGAIVGTYRNEQMFNQLKKKLRKLNIKLIKPKIVATVGNTEI